MLVSSIGVAGFHPEASKFAAWLSGDRRSTAMSVFSVGGNLGVALGPLLAGLIASQFGLGGVWLLAIPGLAIAGAQLAGLAALGGATAHARVRTRARRARPLGRDGHCCWSPSRCAATCTSACSRSSRCSSTTRVTTAAPTARACSR